VLAPGLEICFRSSAPFAGVFDLDALGAAARRRPPRSAHVAALLLSAAHQKVVEQL